MCASTWGKRRWEESGRRSTFGGCWVEYGNCQHLPVLSYITPPCWAPPTGCTEQLTGLVVAFHAQNHHCCFAAWLPPAPSDAYSDSNDFYCMQVPPTALTGIHSLLQTWHQSHMQESTQWAVSRDQMNISKRDKASQVLRYMARSQSSAVTLPKKGKSKSHSSENCHKAQISQCPTYTCLKNWNLLTKIKSYW